ncbi:MAG: division/cell wall cluster transcriptional repressor MraZ [Roseinatronobacter sp.]
MSVPASFRRVIEEGDPDWSEGKRPNFIIVFGLDYQKRLDCYTMAAIDLIDEQILALPPGSARRRKLERVFHEHSHEANVDEDGRIILPQTLRDKLELIPDEKARFIGLNDRFQIWKDETYLEVNKAMTEEEDAGLGPDYDARVLFAEDDEPTGAA